jgi:beta-glucosidase
VAIEGTVDFIVATGIECSAPKIAGGIRRDQLELTGHRERFAEDFAILADMGITHLRYGVPFHLVARHHREFDWAWTDAALMAIREHRLEPIIDLLHFGVPDGMTGFGDPALPATFVTYAAAFADRYPWVRWYTPVNEPFITALFSARNGWWNEMAKTNRSFVQALDNTVTCAIEGMRVIRERRSDAIFLQSDACLGYRPLNPANPRSRQSAAFMQERSWLGFDLTYGHRVSPRMRTWLRNSGMSADRLRWLESHGNHENCIIGLDYYEGNERLVAADGAVTAAERLGFGVLAREVHARYGLPVMLAETNNASDRAVDWLTEVWNDSVELAEEGLPIRGFCWYSLTDQVDWDTCMREANDRVNSFGLVDLGRRRRPVADIYAQLARRAAVGRLDYLPSEGVAA